MAVLLVIRHRPDFGQQVIAISVKIPVFLARDIGVMRVGKADRQAPWPVVMAACKIIDLAGRIIRDLVIIFHLVGNFGHARTGDRAHVVIPPFDPFARLAVIGGPAEIGGIDIGGQALFEPVQLVRADKMHLARQTGLIARAAQVVRIGRDA